MRWRCVVTLGWLATVGGQDGMEPRAPREISLYLFFTPDDPDLSAVPKSVRAHLEVLEKKEFKVIFRAVLLLSDFKEVGQLHANQAFFDFVKEMKELRGADFDLRLYDEEGLDLAERLSIARTPAWALISGARTHVIYGIRGNAEELVSCKR